LRVLGVDPGASGALVIYDTALGTLEIHDMPTYIEKLRSGKKRVRVDAPALGQWLRRQRIDTASLEKVGAMKGQGTTSMFAFGQALGTVEGALGHMGIPVSYYAPKEWQRVCRVAGGEHIKDNARAKAQKFFPGYAGLFTRKKDSGRADATLIAYAKATEGENDAAAPSLPD
jgi:crossover junction endodeoxyribonuclease RuvC